MGEKLEFIEIDSVNEILDLPQNIEYKALLVRTVKKLVSRNYLPYEKTLQEIKEMGNLSISVDDYEREDSDIGMYDRIIGDLDQYRSRLSELLCSSQSDLDFVSEHCDKLFKIWNNYSKQSSADKREGEAEKIIFFLLEEKLKKKEIYDTVKHKFVNINQKMESISRKITIIQEIHKMQSGMHQEYDTKGAFRATRKKIEEASKDIESTMTDEEKNGWDRLLEEVYKDPEK